MGPELSLIAGGIGAAGALLGGVQSMQQANYNRRVAEANATQAEMDAAEEAARVRRQAARIAGTRRAIAGASGVEGGSVIDSAEDQAAEAELEALGSLYMGRREAGRYRQQAQGYRMEGTSALIGGVFKAGGAVFGGLDKYYRNRERLPQEKSGIGNPGYSDLWDGRTRA